MVWAPRYFRLDGQKWTEITARWMNDFFAGTVRVEGGGEAMLTVTVYLDIAELGIPIDISGAQCERWPLLPDGSLDRDPKALQDGLATNACIGPSVRPPGDGTLIHAESRFARHRHQDVAHWKPDTKQWANLVRFMKRVDIPWSLGCRVIEPHK